MNYVECTENIFSIEVLCTGNMINGLVGKQLKTMGKLAAKSCHICFRENSRLCGFAWPNWTLKRFILNGCIFICFPSTLTTTWEFHDAKTSSDFSDLWKRRN